MLPVVVIVGASLFSQGLLRGSPLWALGLAAVAVLLALLVTALQYLAWRRLTYWFDADGDLRVDSGVLTRQQRRLQLSRLQAVDVAAPLIARLVGMAEVRVEVAGSGDSKAVLQYLTRTEAEELRNEIVARSAGVRHDAGEAPEQVVATVPPGELVQSLLLRGSTFGLLAVTVVLVTVVMFTAGPAGLVLVVVGGVPVFTVFTEFTRYYGFTVARADDGLRLRHGLLQTQHQTVPPGRVQAIGFSQPLLWRRRDWVRVQLNIAGVAGGDGDGSASMLLPVAPWPVARAVVGQVMPGLDLDAIELLAAPDRARRRAWIQWRRLGVGHDAQVLVTRRGRVGRHWSVLPHARTQSVRITQGPWQRALSLASVWFDSTPGPVKVVGLHRSADEARELAQAQADRATAARASDRSTRWARGSTD
ncbi:MAG TPA: PH domain-containing protein [Candidatus Nanopelagicales bacterium]|nr:PH domain-containing protein [Candidatus Nanopelagicales bacterium]